MDSNLNTDIVILGGGAAGIAAAVAAARKGLKVVLIERNSFLGGKATAAEVGTVCGLYQFSKKERSAYIVKGFAREFAERLRSGSQTAPLHSPEGLHYLPYDVEVFKNISLELLNENNVAVYFDAVLEHVDIVQDKIISISVVAAGDPVKFLLQSLIDCSGDSMIS